MYSSRQIAGRPSIRRAVRPSSIRQHVSTCLHSGRPGQPGEAWYSDRLMGRRGPFLQTIYGVVRLVRNSDGLEVWQQLDRLPTGARARPSCRTIRNSARQRPTGTRSGVAVMVQRLTGSERAAVANPSQSARQPLRMPSLSVPRAAKREYQLVLVDQIGDRPPEMLGRVQRQGKATPQRGANKAHKQRLIGSV